jgi:glycerate dehydrogenase
MKIVVLDGACAIQNDLNYDSLRELGELTVFMRTKPSEVVERIGDAEAIFTNKVIIDKSIMKKCPNLKFISTLATGFNCVDTKGAEELGIVVCNIPAYSRDSVVQHTFALILELVAQVGRHNESVHNGDWANATDFCYCLTPLVELAGKTLGIIGYGNIGKAVEKVAFAFGMKVIINNRTPFEGSVSAEQVFEESDIVSLHCPLTAENEKFVDANLIGRMMPSAYLINTARGAIINESDLAAALNEGRIAGAGLDTLWTEPPSRENPLLTAKNCFITPHTAWATTEARKRLLDIAKQNLQAFICGAPINKVN